MMRWYVVAVYRKAGGEQLTGYAQAEESSDVSGGGDEEAVEQWSL